MAQTNVQRDSFILRIWREGKDQAWKGWVQHASSGRATPVNTPDELLAFVEQQSGGKTLSSGHAEGERSANAAPQPQQAEALRSAPPDKTKRGAGLK